MGDQQSAADPETGHAAARRWTRRLIQLALTALVTWFIVDRVGVGMADVARLDPQLWRLDWWMLLFASALLLVGYLFAASLWGRMVRELGGPALSAVTSCRIFFTANLGRYVPGKIWQIAGLAYLGTQEGVTASTSMAAAVLGQGLSLVGATLVGLAALLGGDEGARRLGVWALVLGALLLVVVSVPGLFRRSLAVWFKLARRELPGDLAVGPAFGLRWTAIYVVVWGVYAVAFWLLVGSLGLTGSFTEVGPAYAAAYVLGYIAIFAPAGVGVREGFLIVFLDPLLGAASLAVAVISRVWTTVVELGPALAFAGAHFAGRGRGAARDG